jgi:hypothetical protein
MAQQQKSLNEQLVGTWRIVSAVGTYTDGAITDRWGPNATGLAIFDAGGRFVFLTSRAAIPNLASGNVNEGTAEENKAVVQGIICFFGTWSIDEATRIQSMNIEAGSFPNLVGISAKRHVISLTDDEYRYTNAATATGSQTNALWRRVR